MKRILLIDGENLKGKIKAVFDIQREGNLVWHNYNLKDFSRRFSRGLEIDKYNHEIFSY